MNFQTSGLYNLYELSENLSFINVKNRTTETYCAVKYIPHFNSPKCIRPIKTDKPILALIAYST